MTNVSPPIDPGDPAHARYEVLCQAVGGPPVEAYSREVLARLAAWTRRDEVEQLGYLIRTHTGRACQRYRSLVVEVAERLDEKHPASSGGWTILALPDGLATRITQAAK